MNLLLLSRQRWLYSTRRFRESARARGHELSIVDPLECGLAIGADGMRLFFRDRDVPPIDVAIPRIGASLPGQGVAVVGHLEAMRIPLVNDASAIRRARDKLVALQILAARGIDVPRTVLARGPDQVDQALEVVGGPPVVLKLLQGTQGVGVILAETRAAVVATLDTLWGLRQDVILQEYVADSAGRDIRVLVVGGRIVAAMRRQAPPGEWRSNIEHPSRRLGNAGRAGRAVRGRGGRRRRRDRPRRGRRGPARSPPWPARDRGERLTGLRRSGARLPDRRGGRDHGPGRGHRGRA
jgi:ribosomal protein S6--L-glutamate ligase